MFRSLLVFISSFFLQLIGKKQGLDWVSVKKLGELQHRLDVDLEKMISLVNNTLHDQPYTKEEIVKELETTSQELDEITLTSNTKQLQQFKLKQRALHVFQGKCFS